MFKIPGIYVDIKGDVNQLKQDMTRARGLVREAAADISNSLNNALSPAQVQRGTNALIRDLGQVQRTSKLTGDSFKGLGVDLKEVSHLTGLGEKEFAKLQSRMLQTQATKATERALAAIQRQTGLTTLEVIKLRMAMGDTSGALTQMGKLALPYVATAGLAVAAVIYKATQAYSAFQDQVSTVSTMLNRQSMGQENYNRQMEVYSAGLRKLSVDMGESTASLSKGLYDILSASIAPAKAMDVLSTSTMAARAGMTQTTVAVDFITSALNAYGFAAEDAGKVSDIAFATVAQGKLTFEDLAKNIGKVAPQAAQAGISLDLLGAMLATVTRQGVRVEQAATALNSLFVQFSKQTDQQVEAWAEITKGTELAGTAFNSSMLRGENLFKVLDVLAGSNENLRLKVAGEVSALLALNTLLRDTEGLRNDLARTTNAAGEAQEAYNKKINDQSHLQKRAKAATDDFLVSIGKAFSQESKEALEEYIEVMKNLKSVIEGIASITSAYVPMDRVLQTMGNTFSESGLWPDDDEDSPATKYQTKVTLPMPVSLEGIDFGFGQDEQDAIASLLKATTEVSGKILDARKKLQKELELIGLDGYLKEKKLLDQELEANLKFKENAALAHQVYEKKLEELDDKYIKESQKSANEWLNNKRKILEANLAEETRADEARAKSSKALDNELARLQLQAAGKTKELKALEVEQWRQAELAKFGASEEWAEARNKVNEIAAYKLLEINKSTTSKWIDAWSDTSARMEDIMRGTFENLTKSLGDFFGELLFEIRSLDDALKSLESLGKNIAKNLLGSFATSYLQGGIGGLLKGEGFSGFSLGNVGSLLSGGTTAVKGVEYAAALADALESGATISEAMEWASITTQGTGTGFLSKAASTVAGWFGGGTETASLGAQIAAEDTAMSAELLGTAALGPAALFGMAAAPVVVGPMIQPYVDSLIGREAYTPETAQERIGVDFEALGTALENLTQKAQTMGDMFGGYLTPEVMNTASEIENLADIAGYSQAELDKMADGLGEQGTTFVTAAQLAQDLSYQVEDLVNNFHVVNQESQLWQGGLNELNILLSDMVYSMDLGSEATETLKESAFALAQELYLGNMTVEEITSALQTEFVGALEDTIASGEATADTFRKVREAITSIPTSWHTEYQVKGQIPATTTTMQISHQGGQIMHAGGPVGFDYPELRRLHTGGGLLPDERFIIGQTGEWMIQKPAVDFYGPSFMRAVNERRLPRTGGGSTPVFNISVGVQGSNASPEEIARAIKLELKRASESGEIVIYSSGVADRDWNNA